MLTDAESDLDTTAKGFGVGAERVEFHCAEIAVLDLRDTRLRNPKGGGNIGLGLARRLTEFLQMVPRDVGIEVCGRLGSYRGIRQFRM
ncbi:hypothetical protein NS14008_02025 [Nocardia seriolae]|nr:hypothetical protein NS14008_02025 [Nocardia seriolae]